MAVATELTGELLSGAISPVRTIETNTLQGYTQGAFQVYFTRPHGIKRWQEGGLDQTVASDLLHAKDSIDVASFDFDLASITRALLDAHKRGVVVRMVVDSENLTDPRAAYMLGSLEEAGITVAYDRRAAFMHNKFIVIDERVVWTGSWNLTLNDTFRNNNNALRIEDTRVAASYTHTFAALANGGNSTAAMLPGVMVDGTSIQVLYAPTMPVTTEVVRAIAGAQRSVEFLAFSFTSDTIAEALIAAKRAWCACYRGGRAW